MRSPAPRALLLLALLAACEREPTSPLLQTTVAGLFTEGVSLEPGEVITATAGEAQAIFLNGGENGAEYLYVPFNASESGTARLQVEVVGGNVTAPTTPPDPARAAPPWLAQTAADVAGPEPDLGFHYALRERELRELSGRLGARTARAPAARSAVPVGTPRVGDTLRININSGATCTEPDFQNARVAAVGRHALVVEDLSNPAGGFSPEEYQNVAAVFDTLIYPVDVFNFGEPRYGSFIEPRDRVIIFYTRAVNQLTPRGANSYVGGFFFARDLFPRAAEAGLQACPASNEAPIMYLLAPDPSGQIGTARSRAFVLRVTLGTVAHELQHLINAARRIFVTRAQGLEEVWLNEGLSHIAEELMFYHSTGLQPRQNIGLQALRASEQVRLAYATYQASNFGRYIQYLENPDTTSLLGVDNLPTRGASWAFLRYTADQVDGPDAPLFRALVDGTQTGVNNLAAAIPVDPIDLMQRWTVSVYTDDALPTVAFAPVYQQPSWNFREIIPALLGSDGSPIYARYPLNVRALTAEERSFRLLGGGAAFLRFGVPAGGRASIVTTSGGSVPGDRLRISIARLR